MKIKEVMKKPVFVSPEDSLEDVAQTIAQRKINGLLVGNEKKVVGVVTKEDLVKHFGHKEHVSEIMSRSVIVVDMDESIEKTLQLCKKNKINFIPVISKNLIVGVISSKDLTTENSGDEEEEFLFD